MRESAFSIGTDRMTGVVHDYARAIEGEGRKDRPGRVRAGKGERRNVACGEGRGVTR